MNENTNELVTVETNVEENKVVNNNGLSNAEIAGLVTGGITAIVGAVTIIKWGWNKGKKFINNQKAKHAQKADIVDSTAVVVEEQQ